MNQDVDVNKVNKNILKGLRLCLWYLSRRKSILMAHLRVSPNILQFKTLIKLARTG